MDPRGQDWKSSAPSLKQLIERRHLEVSNPASKHQHAPTAAVLAGRAWV